MVALKCAFLAVCAAIFLTVTGASAIAKPAHHGHSVQKQAKAGKVAKAKRQFNRQRAVHSRSGLRAKSRYVKRAKGQRRYAARPHVERTAEAGSTETSSVSTASFGGSNLVEEARRWLGTNPTGRARLWCATFMNFVLKRVGIEGTGSDAARSFASHGTRVSGPRVGAIAVMSRGKQGGHVGVVSGIDAKGNPIIISGNYGRRVAEATFSRGRIYAYVMPN